MLNIGLIAIELGIALSVLVLGLTIALNSNFNKLLIYLFVALFATFHGYAHGLKYTSIIICSILVLCYWIYIWKSRNNFITSSFRV